jgi:hypothetical protein
VLDDQLGDAVQFVRSRSWRIHQWLGTVTIRSSETDGVGEGAIAAVTPDAMRHLYRGVL